MCTWKECVFWVFLDVMSWKYKLSVTVLLLSFRNLCCLIDFLAQRCARWCEWGVKSVLNIHWKDWCWNWSSNTLTIWCKEVTHWKSPWCWKRLKAGGEGDNRGWDSWMASPTWWTWAWASSGSWWWTGKPGMLWSMGSQRVRHNWATELTDIGYI